VPIGGRRVLTFVHAFIDPDGQLFPDGTPMTLQVDGKTYYMILDA
jgi:hypothetical protein